MDLIGSLHCPSTSLYVGCYQESKRSELYFYSLKPLFQFLAQERPLHILHVFNIGQILLHHPPLPFRLPRGAPHRENDDLVAARARHRVGEGGHPMAGRAVVAGLVQGDDSSREIGVPRSQITNSQIL